MARRVFFSFHFEDSWRANQVRMANVVGGADVAGFYDHSLYEEKKRGPEAVRREILRQLDGTSVTVVLIGTHTADRPWVDFEIRESVRRDNGLVGITINHLKAPPWAGAPSYTWGPAQAGRRPAALPVGTPVYAWDGNQRVAFARVIEDAARRGEQLKAAKREGVRRALLAMKPPPIARPSTPPSPLGSSLAEAIRRRMEAERIARLLEPPAPAPPPFDVESFLRSYRLRRILGNK